MGRQDVAETASSLLVVVAAVVCLVLLLAFGAAVAPPVLFSLLSSLITLSHHAPFLFFFYPAFSLSRLLSENQKRSGWLPLIFTRRMRLSRIRKRISRDFRYLSTWTSPSLSLVPRVGSHLRRSCNPAST